MVTLHNQRDFLFFRRHRYMFESPTKARLQEIGPRFTLKLRWMRKGLPAVSAADGSVPRGGDAEDVDEDEINRQEQADEDEAMEEMGSGKASGSADKKKKQKDENGNPDLGIPPLDEEQEYEWKWKVSPLLRYNEYRKADIHMSRSAKDGGLKTNILLMSNTQVRDGLFCVYLQQQFIVCILCIIAAWYLLALL